MYLKQINIKKFRKYDDNDHIFLLAKGKSVKDEKENSKIDIASRTTLIIGKNNSGKSSLIEILNKVINGNFTENDFNYNYLKQWLEKYRKITNNEEKINFLTPTIEMDIIVSLDDAADDIITNLVDFIDIEDIGDNDIEIKVKNELDNTIEFKNKLDEILKENIYEKDNFEKNAIDIKNSTEEYSKYIFNEFLNLISESKFTINYYTKDDSKIKDFSLKKLINLKCISTGNIIKNDSLTSAFSKIIRKMNQSEEKSTDLKKEIYNVNTGLYKKINDNYGNEFNKSISQANLSQKYKLEFISNLTLESLLRNVLKYEYSENENLIPENQFGSGYTNLMLIIAELTDYIYDYSASEKNSKINILTIEEPECFMHPQMQENLLKILENVLTNLVASKKKNINTQLLITTHSSHILNSKLQDDSGFNNIDYICTGKDSLKIVNLTNQKIMLESADSKKKSDDETNFKDFKFIKKHITYQASELFFADAAIFVEGITEYNLIKHRLLHEENDLKNYYITVFLVGGAHAYLYENLIKALKIPTVIITDNDFKLVSGDNEETQKYNRVTKDNIKNFECKNNTIKHFFNSNKPSDLINQENDIFDNIKIVYQKYYNDEVCPTSFEEALLLANKDNNEFLKVIKNLFPEKSKKILKNVVDYSTEFQNMIANSKTDFANEILFEQLGNKDFRLEFPKYIEKGLNFLMESLTGTENGK